MPNSTFHFKQFSIEQDRCAMKVGTDGVLLGAWAGRNQHPKRILDVGTGTGLIALMMAQRFPESDITALEIDKDAAIQARENVNHSPFDGQIEIVHTNYFDWYATNHYDLIVCNPPFYKHAHPAKSAERSVARHGIEFDFSEFMSKSRQIASPDGRLAVILPVHIYEQLDIKDIDWKPSRKCSVSPTPDKPPNRCLIEWSSSVPENIHEGRLVIESEGRHQYSPEYVALTKSFYLKM